MWRVNVQNAKSIKQGYLITFGRKSKYRGYQTLIPSRYVVRVGFERFIDLPDAQKLKIKKGDDVQIKTIKELKQSEE